MMTLRAPAAPQAVRPTPAPAKTPGFWRWAARQAVPVLAVGAWLVGFCGWLAAVVFTP